MHKPTLIIIGGFAGAGKTTIATKLSSKYNYPLFSSDIINDALRLSLQKTFHEVSPTAYEVMWFLVRKQLSLGLTVVVDVHMATTKIWESIDALKHDMPNVKILPILLQDPLETHRIRIEERGLTNKEHLNLGGDKLEDVLFKYEFIKKLIRPDLIRVDANRQPDEVYRTVEVLINKHM